MHRNFLFDLDQTLLDFHASEHKALGIVLKANGLSFSDEIYQAFKAYNKSLWLELEKGTITRTELFTKRFLDVFSRSSIVWFMPSGDIEAAMAAYDINYCASSFDELFEVLKRWSNRSTPLPRHQ